MSVSGSIGAHNDLLRAYSEPLAAVLPLDSFFAALPSQPSPPEPQPPASKVPPLPRPPAQPPQPPLPPTGPAESSTAIDASAERPLLPHWQRVPSRSRPGEFSYLHLRTGLKQRKFPVSEPSDTEVAEHLAVMKRLASSGKKRAAPLMQNEPTAAWHAYLKKKKS